MADLFTSGELDIEGNLYAALRSYTLIRSSIEGEAGAIVRIARQCLQVVSKAARFFFLFDRTNSGATQAVPYIPNLTRPYGFFRAWLGCSMAFCVASFRTFWEDLDDAQEAGMERICRQLRLRSGDRFLDLSCDWGSLLLYVSAQYHISAHGFTRSNEQLSTIDLRILAAGRTSQCTVRFGTHLDLEEIHIPFDKIAATGFTERVCPNELGDYFRNVYRKTSPGGLFLCDFATVSVAHQREVESLSKAVFAGGGLPTLNQILRDAEDAGFSVLSVEDLNEQYEETLRLWFHGLTKNRPELEQMSDVRTLRSWELSIACSMESVRAGHSSFHRVLLRNRICDPPANTKAAVNGHEEPEQYPPLSVPRLVQKRRRRDDYW